MSSAIVGSVGAAATSRAGRLSTATAVHVDDAGNTAGRRRQPRASDP